ncbi:HlyD family secretion protein [Caulobacter sp. 17J80-11]|uniref:HlyD family secretion protein n=1 Tax=Caulobacter sp. 17J80-11 TaxID=2763502 RepID=UPI0016537D34|nr:HlyD family efflux transporter periplasmic adaptor subunit [Caulobacter sp. 17J80-11]MBC6980995.1 HlyD family efflux transporter periplasmic adaptor subunit [Caulobacter sp. 17J80-11]
MFGIFRSKAFWVVVFLLVVGGGGFFMMSKKAEAEKQKAAAAAAAPKVVTPYAAIANGKADVEGGIIQVAARRAGIVEEVLVQEGEAVTKGQVLARQESNDPRLAVERARAEVGQAQAQIAATEVQLVAARREYDRMRRLSDTNYIAAQKLDEARDAVRTAEATLQAQRAAVATAQARQNEAQYDLELTVVRAPADGVIVRRYANPGAGASTLNVSNMFDLEPKAARIVRAEITESAIPSVTIGQEVEIVPESDETKVYVGQVLRRAAVFGARKLQSDDPSERTDDRVVEVVVSADGAPFLIGQRVLVKFMKPGEKAGVKRAAPKPAAGPQAKG